MKNVDLHSEEGGFCRFNEIPGIAGRLPASVHHPLEDPGSWRGSQSGRQVDIMESGSATISSQCWEGKDGKLGKGRD